MLYWCFTLFGQLVLLNLLIAVVGSARAAVHVEAARVAIFSRAKIIIEKGKELDDELRKGLEGGSSFPMLRRLMPSAALVAHLERWEKAQEARTQRRHQHMCPRWLHVLVPVKPDLNSDETGLHELNKVSALRKQIGRS